MANARKFALKALLEVEENHAYSNLILDKTLNGAPITPQDKSLITAIFYGVLDRRITIDYIISEYSSIPIRKINPITLTAMRIALYQIMYMDRIPPSAAVNESVELVKHSPERRNFSFVNAVLRNVLRHGIHLPQTQSSKNLSIIYSCPLPIVESFINDYGMETAIELLEHSLKVPPVTVRVNTTKLTTPELFERLSKENITAHFIELSDALVIDDTVSLRSTDAYKEGLFHIQDSASQLCVAALSPKPGEKVLDVCAAPGGKSFTMAELMENKGSITALDVHKHRVELITNGAKRLGLDIIKTACEDATKLSNELGTFDAVLCDVPCSGLGVIRRKPEIKYKPIEEFEELPLLQYDILQNASKRVKNGGRLLYSTCTLRIAENEDVVHRFLENNKGFSLQYEHCFMPHIDSTDGFYCALLGKEK